MQLISLPCGPLAVNTYIVSDGVGGPVRSSTLATPGSFSTACGARGTHVSKSCLPMAILTISGAFLSLSPPPALPLRSM